LDYQQARLALLARLAGRLFRQALLVTLQTRRPEQPLQASQNSAVNST
jgi:hypothetical protein